jgi:predicted small lipoprotein YifL
LRLVTGDARFVRAIWYGAQRKGRLQVGIGVVNRSVDRWRRPALAAALLAALALGACGRKGPLDPPPTGLNTPQTYTQRPSIGEEGDSLAPSFAGDRPPARQQGAPPPGTGPKPAQRSFFLDFLLGK